MHIRIGFLVVHFIKVVFDIKHAKCYTVGCLPEYTIQVHKNINAMA